MAVTYAERRNTLTGSDDANVRTIIDIWIVNVSLVTDDQSTLMTSNFAGLPQVGAAHPSDNLVTVKGRSFDRSSNHLQWEMTVTYNNASDANDQGGGGGGGGQIIKVQISAWEERYIMESDFSKKTKRLENSAKEALKLEISRFHPQITITKITQNPNLQVVNNVGAVNSGRWIELGFVFEPDQLLFAAYNTDSLGNNTWQEQFVLKAKLSKDFTSSGGGDTDKGWQPFLLDAGFSQLINKELVPIRVKNDQGEYKGRPVSKPWPLNGNGIALKIEEIEANTNFIEFQAYRKTNFGQFNFDFAPLFAPLPAGN